MGNSTSGLDVMSSELLGPEGKGTINNFQSTTIMLGELCPTDQASLGKLSYHRGDIFEVAGAHPCPVLVHSCNIKTGWGCGVAAHFATRFPYAKLEYDECRQNLGVDDLLGRCLWIQPPEDATGNIATPTQHIACLFVKERGGAPVGDQEKLELLHYFRLALEDLKTQLRDRCNESSANPMILFSPKMNAGIFNISWRVSEEIIKQSGLDFNIVFRASDKEKTPDQFRPIELREQDMLMRSKMAVYQQHALNSDSKDCMIPWLPGPYPPSMSFRVQLQKSNKLAEERRKARLGPTKRHRKPSPDSPNKKSRRILREPSPTPRLKLTRPAMPSTPRQKTVLPRDPAEKWCDLYEKKHATPWDQDESSKLCSMSKEDLKSETDLIEHYHEYGDRLSEIHDEGDKELEEELEKLHPAEAVERVRRERAKLIIERTEVLFRQSMHLKKLSIIQLEQLARLEKSRSKNKQGASTSLLDAFPEPKPPSTPIFGAKTLASSRFTRTDSVRQTPNTQQGTARKSSFFSRSKEVPAKVTFKLDGRGKPLMKRFGYRAEKPIVDLTGSDNEGSGSKSESEPEKDSSTDYDSEASTEVNEDDDEDDVGNRNISGTDSDGEDESQHEASNESSVASHSDSDDMGGDDPFDSTPYGSAVAEHRANLQEYLDRLQDEDEDSTASADSGNRAASSTSQSGSTPSPIAETVTSAVAFAADANTATAAVTTATTETTATAANPSPSLPAYITEAPSTSHPDAPRPPPSNNASTPAHESDKSNQESKKEEKEKDKGKMTLRRLLERKREESLANSTGKSGANVQVLKPDETKK